MLKPIITAMLKRLHITAKITVCQDPLLGGVYEATKWERIQEVIEQYQYYVDLFLLCVDRDGESGRRGQLNFLEDEAKRILPAGKCFLAENAWQEIEVWVLAGHKLPKRWDWRDIRTNRNPKEVYYLPFAKSRNLLDEPGEGRKKLATEAAKNYKRIRRLCPEDVENLEQRIAKCVV